MNWRQLAPKPVLRPVYGAEATGVAGWLGLLWIVLVFLLPAFAVQQGVRLLDWPGLARFPDEAQRWIVMIEWSGAAAIAGLCWFLAWRLSRRPVWRSVEMVIAGVWVWALLIPVAKLFALALAADLPFAAMLEGGADALVARGVIAALWTAYLLRSRRVARTYVKPDSAREIAGAFE